MDAEPLNEPEAAGNGKTLEVSAENIGEVEKSTLVFVDRAISSLQAAMSGLKATDEAASRIFDACHSLLAWREDFLSKGEDEAFEARVARLRELADICEAYR